MEGYSDRINVDRILLNHILIMLDNNVYVPAAFTCACNIGVGKTPPAV
jgi:hypothetical protein